MVALRSQVKWRQVRTVCLWVPITLLPYSFVSYMPRLPSRHHYLASVGFCLLVGSAMALVASGRRRHWLPLLLMPYVLHNVGYLWFYKEGQFRERARPYEASIAAAGKHSGAAVRLACFPGNPDELRRALRFRVARPVELILLPADDSGRADLSFCHPPDAVRSRTGSKH
jgi:hypothetical protein